MLTNQNSTAFWLIDTLWMPLATSHHTQDNFSLLEQVCPVGGPQTHMHPTEEGMYILEGHVIFQVGGQEVKAGPGTFASIPGTQTQFCRGQPGNAGAELLHTRRVRDNHHEPWDTRAKAQDSRAWNYTDARLLDGDGGLT